MSPRDTLLQKDGNMDRTEARSVSADEAACSAAVAPSLWERWKDRLGQQELRRRLWHFSPGLLPPFLWPTPHQDPIGPWLWALLIVLIGGFTLLARLKYRHIQRADERFPEDALFGYAGSVLLTFALFPGQAEFGMAVVALIAFGDGSATFFGLLLGGPTLPWNREKTWIGTLCFVACGAPVAAVYFWGEAQPAVSFLTACACVFPAAAVAAFAESLPLWMNDNLRVGLVAASGLAVMHGLVIGY